MQGLGYQLIDQEAYLHVRGPKKGIVHLHIDKLIQASADGMQLHRLQHHLHGHPGQKV